MTLISMIETQLTDKVAIVTGCNNPHGVGAAIALALADQGVHICAHYFRTESTPQNTEQSEMGESYYYAQQTKTADWLVEKIQSRGGKALAFEADLADTTTIPKLFDAAEQLGPVSIVINNAAYSLPDTLFPVKQDARAANHFPVQAISQESIDKHFAANTRATALVMHEFAQRHQQREAKWGRIINISTDGASGFPTEVSYGASKYAIESMSRAAAHDFGPLGITVNVLSLGPVQTGWIDPDLEKALIPTIPLGRIGAPADVADVAVFLASEQARYLTGQLIFVGGGHRTT